MAFTETEQNRIATIELKLNEIQTALNNVPSKTQMKALLSLRQAEIEELKLQVAALEAQVAALQA